MGGGRIRASIIANKLFCKTQENGKRIFVLSNLKWIEMAGRGGRGNIGGEGKSKGKGGMGIGIEAEKGKWEGNGKGMRKGSESG
jgi:hypothetical protein